MSIGTVYTLIFLAPTGRSNVATLGQGKNMSTQGNLKTVC